MDLRTLPKYVVNKGLGSPAHFLYSQELLKEYCIMPRFSLS